MSDINSTFSTAKAKNHDDSVYYFSHIPKTGGTSFTAILDRFFDVKDIFEPQLWWEVGDVEAVRKKNYKCIRGHFGMGAQALSNHKLKTLTILRDPLRMAYSTYQYVKREPSTAVHKYVTENQLTFEAFLQDPKTRNLAKNRMTKSLSFGLGLLPIQPGLVVTPDNYKLCRKQWNKGLKKMAPEQVLELVKSYLDSCLWVGILEDFESSLMMLCHLMSWPAIGPTEKLNTHPKVPKISDQAKSLVKKMNHFDYLLYDYAKANFEDKLEALFNKKSFSPEEFKAVRGEIDEKYQGCFIEQYNIPLAEYINYDFSMPLLGQNWHSREWSEPEQTYFRWTGPEGVTTIDFWLKPQEYVVSLEFINLTTDDLLKNLVITVNDKTVNWQVKFKARAGVIVFLCKQAYFRQHGLFRLKMMVDNLNTHHCVFNSNDNRKVGFAMKSITIHK